ncbi:MAG: hypothetical protein NTV52_04350 [Acidobacteria bacterium]|nr:hypothetical protein [Acidobacteriota bacterium]
MSSSICKRFAYQAPPRRAAELVIRCLRHISERFDRPDEIRNADIELSRSLRR